MKRLHLNIMIVALCAAIFQVATAAPPSDPFTQPADAATTNGSLEISARAPATEESLAKSAAKAPAKPANTPKPIDLTVKPAEVATATPRDEAVLRNMVEATRSGLVAPIKPPQAEITMKSGTTEIIPISIGRMNRIITPFADPIVQTTSDAAINRQGKVLNIATDQPAAVSLFVMDRNDPDHALSLTLTPAAIPPVQVTLHLDGYVQKAPGRDRDPDKSGATAATAYVDAIKALLRGVALGKIPDGFTLHAVQATESRSASCRIPGVEIRPAQTVEGHAMSAVVARAVNATIDPIEIDETSCNNRKILAVAAWPRTHLEPGEETELYIVVRAASPDDGPAERPSVLRAASAAR